MTDSGDQESAPLGARLAAERWRRGIGYLRTERETGVGKTTLKRIEDGHPPPPSFDTVERIERWLAKEARDE